MRVDASIIVPVFNREQYLCQCLDSALAQTHAEFEVVCVDNGSTDGSLSIIRDYQEKDARVRLVEEPRRGVSCARNAGIEAAVGRYVVFLDSDDFIEPNLLEVAIAQAEAHGSEAVVYSLDECHDGSYLPPDVVCRQENVYGRAFKLEDLDDPSTALTIPSSCRILFSKAFLDRARIRFPEHLRSSEDLAFVYQVLFSTERLSVVKDCLYHYRRDHEDSLTRKSRHNDGPCALRLIKETLDAQQGARPGLERHFVNLVLDTFEYQLGTCASLDEFHELFGSWESDWREYCRARKELVVARYRAFYDQATEQGAESYLYYLFNAHRQTLERQSVEIVATRSDAQAAWGERDRLRAELDELYGSWTYRAGRAIVWLPAKLKALMRRN